MRCSCPESVYELGAVMILSIHFHGNYFVNNLNVFQLIIFLIPDSRESTKGTKEAASTFVYQTVHGNNRETIAAIEANNDTCCLQSWTEKFRLFVISPAENNLYE